MSSTVTLEYKGKIAIITIDNEKKLNALTQDGYYQLATYMREVAEREEVYITILTGKGKFSLLLTSLKSQLTEFVRAVFLCVSYTSHIFTCRVNTNITTAVPM